jgi:solute carrier family 25 carnitine/acylcarnitine transporter 20/29
MDQSLKDIIAGFISGWTQVIIMQPFEIVKIRLQTQTPGNAYYNGMVDCFKKITKDEGLSAFYKGKSLFYSGTVSPLIGIGFQSSAMFFTYQACKRYFNQFK